MSRKTRARRKARKARPKRPVITPSKEPWGTASGELTPQDTARILARFSNMRHRGFRFGFTFPFGWVEARNPEELEEAVRQKLLDESKGKPKN